MASSAAVRRRKKEEEEMRVMLTTQADFASKLELCIRVVDLAETNEAILERVQNAILQCPPLSGRLILRAASRVIIEIESSTVLVDCTLSPADLERIVLVKLPEAPNPPGMLGVLYDALKKTFEQGSEYIGEEEEEEELICLEEPLSGGGPMLSSKLDANYMMEVRRAMQKRLETELNAFALPLERRAKDDERRVLLLQDLISQKYRVCEIALPRLEQAPALAAFSTDTFRLDESQVMLRFTKSNPSSREVDLVFKSTLSAYLLEFKRAREERKHREIVARGEVCERNRALLVQTLASNSVAQARDKESLEQLGIAVPTVILCEVSCMYSKRPAQLVITPNCLIIQFKVWGFTFGESIKLDAASCHSVHKIPPTLTLVESICVRMRGSNGEEEHHFYLPSLLEDSSLLFDQLFELIWQVLRMNRQS